MYLTIYIGDILSIKTGVIHQNKKLEKKFTGKQNKSFFPSKKTGGIPFKAMGKSFKSERNTPPEAL